MSLDIEHHSGSLYLVPFIVAEIVNVSKFRKSSPASIVDEDIDSTELFHGLLDQPSTICCDSDILRTM